MGARFLADRPQKWPANAVVRAVKAIAAFVFHWRTYDGASIGDVDSGELCRTDGAADIVLDRRGLGGPFHIFKRLSDLGVRYAACSLVESGATSDQRTSADENPILCALESAYLHTLLYRPSDRVEPDPARWRAALSFCQRRQI